MKKIKQLRRSLSGKKSSSQGGLSQAGQDAPASVPASAITTKDVNLSNASAKPEERSGVLDLGSSAIDSTGPKADVAPASKETEKPSGAVDKVLILPWDPPTNSTAAVENNGPDSSISSNVGGAVEDRVIGDSVKSNDAQSSTGTGKSSVILLPWDPPTTSTAPAQNEGLDLSILNASGAAEDPSIESLIKDNSAIMSSGTLNQSVIVTTTGGGEESALFRTCLNEDEFDAQANASALAQEAQDAVLAGDGDDLVILDRDQSVELAKDYKREASARAGADTMRKDDLKTTMAKSKEMPSPCAEFVCCM